MKSIAMLSIAFIAERKQDVEGLLNGMKSLFSQKFGLNKQSQDLSLKWKIIL